MVCTSAWARAAQGAATSAGGIGFCEGRGGGVEGRAPRVKRRARRHQADLADRLQAGAAAGGGGRDRAAHGCRAAVRAARVLVGPPDADVLRLGGQQLLEEEWALLLFKGRGWNLFCFHRLFAVDNRRTKWRAEFCPSRPFGRDQ